MKTTLAPAFAAILITLASHPVSAYIADGHSWEIACNANGFVLQSTLPVSRILGYGAGASVSEAREKLILGKSCDAKHSALGEGSWCYSNGGFEARFDEASISFGHKQEPWCESGPEVEMDCLCRD